MRVSAVRVSVERRERIRWVIVVLSLGAALAIGLTGLHRKAERDLANVGEDPPHGCWVVGAHGAERGACK